MKRPDFWANQSDEVKQKWSESKKEAWKLRREAKSLPEVVLKNAAIWDEKQDEIIATYSTEGIGVKLLSERFGFSSKIFLQRKLKALGVLRDASSAHSLAMKRCNPMSSEESRRKVSEATHGRDWKLVIEKRIKTNLVKYGSEHAMQCVKVKQKSIETFLKRWGETNPMKTEEGFSRAFANRKYMPIYEPRNIRMRSKLEIAHAASLDSNPEVASWEYEPLVIPTSVGRYHPDFLVCFKNGKREVHEIKCEWSLKRKEQNTIKLNEAKGYLAQLGVEFKVFVMG